MEMSQINGPRHRGANMAARSKKDVVEQLVLDAATAVDLMVASPVSLRAEATLAEALELLIGKGYSAAPVIDEAGRAVGVLSRSDLLVHDRERVRGKVPDYYSHADLTLAGASPGYRPEADATVRVRDLMTPAVFAVSPDAPARRVVEDMVALKVHRLFVSDSTGVLVGVISALDVLARIRSKD
jgi:CBS domain-containing protein